MPVGVYDLSLTAWGDIPAADIGKHLKAGTGGKLATAVLKKLKAWDYDALRRFCADLVAQANAKDALRKPAMGEKTLVIDADGFEPELENRDSKLMVDAFRLGWKSFIAYYLVGQRFHGVGLGPDTVGVRIDLYGSSGDYEASGIDGLEMHIHGNAQDQLGQIMKAGKLVVNDGHFHPVTDADWALIKPHLVKNEKLFGIKVDDLLTRNGKMLKPAEAFRKVGAMKPAEAVKIIADDVNLGMISSVAGKKRKKGAA